MDKKKIGLIAVLLFLLIGLGTFVFANPDNEEKFEPGDTESREELESKEDEKSDSEETLESDETDAADTQTTVDGGATRNARTTDVTGVRGTNNTGSTNTSETTGGSGNASTGDSVDYYAEALKAVESAESSLKQADVDLAKTAIDKVTDDKQNKELTDRINEVQNIIDVTELISELEAKTNKATSRDDIESAVDFRNENKIETLVESLKDGEVKENLASRLETVNKILNDNNGPVISGIENDSYTNEKVTITIGDDNEFTEQNYYHEEVTPEPRIVEVVKKEETLETPTTKHEEVEVNSYYSNDDYNKSLYHGGDYTDNLSHEYGTYEKEKKPVFKPSPIISPIYGILDKNYKKEEIMPKREVHLSSYSRERVTVDEVRRKAYGNLTDDLAADINGEEEKKAKVVEEVKEEDNLLVDLSDDEKPTVSEVTVGDAEEYFNDLGLEYNIDYKDSSKERATGRRVTEDYDEEEKKKEEPVTDKKEESVVATDPSTDDNLFDLIDSMYEDEDKE